MSVSRRNVSAETEGGDNTAFYLLYQLYEKLICLESMEAQEGQICVFVSVCVRACVRVFMCVCVGVRPLYVRKIKFQHVASDVRLILMCTGRVCVNLMCDFSWEARRQQVTLSHSTLNMYSYGFISCWPGEHHLFIIYISWNTHKHTCTSPDLARNNDSKTSWNWFRK